MNAPSASDRPNEYAAYPTPSAMVVVVSRNSSREFHCATRDISRGTTRVATRTVTVSRTNARPVARITRDAPPLGLLSSGSTIISGTTARSWTTSIPSITRLESVPIRPCACSVLSATIVLDNAMRAPNQSARCQLHPNAAASATPNPMVSAICSAPPATATNRTGASSRNETSSPSENRSSATPSSASCSIPSTWRTVSPPVNGPTMTPARM